MGLNATQCLLVIFIGLGLCILLLKPAENFHTPSRKWKGKGPDALPWGGWDQLVLPNPLDRPPFPPANGGKQWQEPLLLAYGGSPVLNCGTNRRNTC